MPITLRHCQTVLKQIFHQQAVGQTGHRVEVGQLAYPRLRVAAFRDVEPAANQFQRPAGRVAQNPHPVAHPAIVAGGIPPPIFDRDFLNPADSFERRVDPWQVLTMGYFRSRTLDR